MSIFCSEYEIPIFEELLADDWTRAALGKKWIAEHEYALEMAKRHRTWRLEREAHAS